MNAHILYTTVILSPFCVKADTHNPEEHVINFMGNASPISKTSLPITFQPRDKNKTVEENKKYFMDFYSQVQLHHEGYFLAELPLFSNKKTTLFRMGNKLNYNYIENVYTVNCSAYCCWEYADNVFDTTPPIITLLGLPSLRIDKDSTYTDAGATATDNVDGDVTANIITVNSVDTTTNGNYTVTYNVADSSNNVAVEVVRNVEVAEEVTYKYVRYIKVTQNGGHKQESGDNFNGNYIAEIEAYDNTGTLKSLNTVATLLEDGSELSWVTDGNIVDSDPIGYGTDTALVDLGQVENIASVKVYRKWDELEIFEQTKIEISSDNTNWITIQDSAVDGEYLELENGSAFSTI